jgi:hypothetical protein
VTWGLLATLAMSVFMAIGIALVPGVTRSPLPFLIIGHLFPHEGMGWTAAASIVGHLGYGTLVAIPFVYLARPMTLGKGIGYAMLLWFTMQVIFIPWLGWGDFGLIRSPWLALYTMIMHLPYGVTLGWLGARDERLHHATFDDLGRLESQSA